MLLSGIDGCPAGWLVVTRDTHAPALTPAALAIAVVSDAAALVAHTAAHAVIAIDVPIGLPDAGSRACDLLARRVLGVPRASSVFPAPVRPALEATDYRDALARSRAADGRGLSVQAWGILPRVRDVDAALRASPAWAARVCEVHPELCFHAMHGDRPLAGGKRSPEGRAARLALVEAHFGPVVAALRAAVPRRAAADDDLLDALAALWTAERVAAGAQRTIPDPPERDRLGLPMAMTV